MGYLASTLQDKISLFQQVKFVTKPGGFILVIDYTTQRANLPKNPPKRADQNIQDKKEKSDGEHDNLQQANIKKSIYPIDFDEMPKILNLIGLEVIEIIDITASTREWGELILDVISSRLPYIKAIGFTQDEIVLMKLKVESIKDQLDKGTLGSHIFILRKKP